MPKRVAHLALKNNGKTRQLRPLLMNVPVAGISEDPADYSADFHEATPLGEEVDPKQL